MVQSRHQATILWFDEQAAAIGFVLAVNLDQTMRFGALMVLSGGGFCIAPERQGGVGRGRWKQTHPGANKIALQPLAKYPSPP